MVRHPSILLIEDSSGERELFCLALAQTGIEVALFTEQDAEAAFHFLHDRFRHQSEQALHSISSEAAGVVSTARVERGTSEAARSASTETIPVASHSFPSLILLDWHLGKQRGDEFLKRLRADSRLAAIPVVVFTTSDDASDLSLAYASGANGYVMKPDTFVDLIQCIGDICTFWLARNLAPHMVETQC
jgi:chemotaxis family two-component system response regulator Rcp1